MRFGDEDLIDGLAYADPRYAASLHQFGAPFELGSSGSWALRRSVPDAGCFDAMGCYPLFSCRDWSQLATDLDNLPADLVSLTVITDPFGVPSESELLGSFDAVVPFKDHYLLDLDLPVEAAVARRHRKSARKALKEITVEQYDPRTDLATWCELYGHIVARHRVTGIRAFSPAAFAAQAEIPGLIALKASLGSHVVGLHWYLTAGDVVYAHLAALHPDAYTVHASHGLFWAAIELFAGRYRWLDLGAGSGTGEGTDGLTEFKAGWSSDLAPTYVCGRIVDRDRFDELAPGGRPPIGYFPPYRAGEFSSALDRAAR
jgi:Acetyltransferase (GNAT) domain